MGKEDLAAPVQLRVRRADEFVVEDLELLAGDEPVVVDVEPRHRPARRRCAWIASTATRATSFEARMGMLPKPTHTGGVPASRNTFDSAGSGRSSGRRQGLVRMTSCWVARVIAT